MNGEAYTNLVTFQRTQPISDGAGGFEPGAAKIVVLKTFAAVKNIKASRVAENFQEQINATYEVRFLKRSNFIPDITHSVLYRGREHSIMEMGENTKDLKEWAFIIVDRGKGV